MQLAATLAVPHSVFMIHAMSGLYRRSNLGFGSSPEVEEWSSYLLR